MRGSGGSDLGGRGVGEDDSYNRQIHTLIDHGGGHCLTAAMEPHSWHQSIQQSTNKLRKWSMLLKLEKIIIINVYWLVYNMTHRWLPLHYLRRESKAAG